MGSGINDPSNTGVGTGGMTAYNDGRDSPDQTAKKGKGLFARQTLRKVMKDRAYDDLHTLGTDPAKLGFTAAERQNMIDESAQAGQTQRSAAATELGRQALAGQGFQQGAFADTARKVAGDAAQDVASAASEVTDLNEQKIQAEKARILQEVNGLQDRRRESAKFWGKFALDGAAAIGSLAVPG